jgi:hypothetical protein
LRNPSGPVEADQGSHVFRSSRIATSRDALSEFHSGRKIGLMAEMRSRQAADNATPSLSPGDGTVPASLISGKDPEEWPLEADRKYPS